MGEGSNVCNGGREQESLHCIALSGWWNQTALAKALVRGARKIRLSCYDFWGEQLQNFHSSFSLSILISEITKFHFQSSEFHHDGIHIPVYSLSLIADRSSHSFNQNGQPCETLNSCSRLLNSTNSTNMYTLGTNMYTWSTNMYTLGTNMYTLGTNMYTLSTNMYTLGTNMYTLSTNMYTLGTNMDTLGTNMYTLGTNMCTLGTNMDTLGTNMDTLGTNMYTLGTNMDTLGTNMYTLGTNMYTLGTDMDTLGTNMYTLDTNMFTLGTNIYILGTNIRCQYACRPRKVHRCIFWKGIAPATAFVPFLWECMIEEIF